MFCAQGRHLPFTCREPSSCLACLGPTNMRHRLSFPYPFLLWEFSVGRASAALQSNIPVICHEQSMSWFVPWTTGMRMASMETSNCWGGDYLDTACCCTAGCGLSLSGQRRFVEPFAKGGSQISRINSSSLWLDGCPHKLGASSNPYDATFAGFSVPKEQKIVEEVQPFHDLGPEKIKIHGAGSWDALPYLNDSLAMAFREPKVLLRGQPSAEGPVIRNQPETLVALAKKWDDRGILHVHKDAVRVGSLVRIFGSFKDTATHRQIGDKRGRNAMECRIQGVSRDLLSGADLGQLYLDPNSHSVRISIADRKDFCCQLRCASAKAVIK